MTGLRADWSHNSAVRLTASTRFCVIFFRYRVRPSIIGNEPLLLNAPKRCARNHTRLYPIIYLLAADFSHENRRAVSPIQTTQDVEIVDRDTTPLGRGIRKQDGREA